MKVVIIDYGAGNIQSIKFSVQRLGFDAELSDDYNVIRLADRVIFPGVGEASNAMLKLKATGLDVLIPQLKQPVLGICLGMQLMCNHSSEGDTAGLGIFDIDVKKFNNGLKVPQIGWNKISKLETALFKNIKESTFMYLVHSYYVPLCKDTIAITDYGLDYSSALHKDNFYGVQFHPEKSSTAGEQLIKNFLEL